MPVSPAGVAYIVAGTLVLISGIKGATITATIKSALSGSLNPPDTETVSWTSGQQGNASTSTASATGAASGAVTSGSASAAQSYAQSQLSKYGWDSSQWPYLQELWQRESGWSNTADNPTSGAYGIAQALPSTKYPLAGRPPSEGGSSDAQAQIDWGMAYIKGRYGTPQMAWAHEEANGWY